jgi:hypothetical protein
MLDAAGRDQLSRFRAGVGIGARGVVDLRARVASTQRAHPAPHVPDRTALGVLGVMPVTWIPMRRRLRTQLRQLVIPRASSCRTLNGFPGTPTKGGGQRPADD